MLGLLGLLVALPLAAAEPAEQDGKPTKEMLAEFRNELQSVETEIVSKSVSLSTEEATRFWPVFKRFQAEQAAVIDAQVAAVREYADDYAAMTDQDSLEYVQALLDRDQRIHDLREKYLREYAKVIDPGQAARVIQISRRLGLASQARLANAIPLVN
ncbi:hypothetical protein [Pseudoxanthomonas kaohsiungensis]|uniref:Transcriptional regulator n=1 Tax=Pseudoxanthomonas kaohsiungensis TaxID=283923 RepID=A0ABW3LY60_9GAMM|nr:hypothetical protein [Pseudoxanthomonas kaohsiungensis]